MKQACELHKKFSQLLRSGPIPNKDGLLISAIEDEYYGFRGEKIP